MYMIKRDNSSIRHAWRNAMAWRIRHVADNHFLMAMAVVTGVGAGAGAWLLKWLVSHISIVITSRLNDSGLNWALLFIPLIGILLTGLFVRYVLRYNLEHGVSHMMGQLKKGNYVMKRREMFGYIAAAVLTLSFGGSAGGEGPSASTGGAIGSNIGRACHARPTMMRLMIGIGAGAGIAGIFKAPIGGALFALEVMAMPLSTWPVLSLIVACVIASLTCGILSGQPLDMNISVFGSLPSEYLPCIILLGLCCGVYSMYYSSCCNTTDHFFKSVSSPWIRNIISGLWLGAMIMLFPMLYGEGYASMAKIIDGHHRSIITDSIFAWGGIEPDLTLLMVAGTMLLLKGYAKSATTSGGGVAGDFAPTLFAGCLLGFVFAYGANTLTGTDLPVSMIVYIAMAGVMAGAVEAPLMAIFIVAEMSSSFTLLLPLTLCAFTSYATVRICSLRRGLPRRSTREQIMWHGHHMISADER